MKIDLEVKIGKIKLKNPVMVASGTFGYAEEFESFIDLNKLGAIVTKTITLNPRSGNLPPRTCETPAGMLNSIGLENPGLSSFLKNKLPILERYKTPVIVSIASEGGAEEFIMLIKELNRARRASAIELNISCPNIKPKGKSNGFLHNKLVSQDPNATYDLVKKLRKISRKTLITKLSPNITDITEVACAAEDAGSDAVSLVNTFSGMSIDIETRMPKIASLVGGLSGPAIRPIALKLVWEVRQKVKIPIIGMGGISDSSSALEFIIAGANAISVGTANFIYPKTAVEIIRGIETYFKKNNIFKLNNLVGSLKYEA